MTVECVEEKVLRTSRAEEYVFTIIGKLELAPAFAGRILSVLEIRQHVKGGEWLSVEVTEVIKKNCLRGWRCDCKDIAGGVPSREICAMKIKFATRVLGSCIPDAEGVVFTAGKEVVLAWMEGETRDILFMALKIPQVRVVMGG